MPRTKRINSLNDSRTDFKIKPNLTKQTGQNEKIKITNAGKP